MLSQTNKLFIIGNGFDLAHGLKTSYKDFIDNFWEDEKTKILKSNQFYKKNNENFYQYNDDILIFKTPEHLERLSSDILPKYSKGFDWFLHLISNMASSNYIFHNGEKAKIIITIKNCFLQKISEIAYLQNWVDIESIYYSVLKNCYKIQTEKQKTEYTVDMLNKDFLEIRNFLEIYLSPNTSNRIGTVPEILDKLKSIIQPELFTKGNKLNEKDNILFLVFNYTNTIDEYISYFKNQIPQNINSIQIHGELKNPNNPIIFGYGDELDEEYVKMENTNNNYYLENIKSIKYLQTPNYKKLLNFIESYAFNVYIMGHSCGMSDRTLLNTIFESDNCKSIKIFYHKREDGTDDHNEKIMNISRNFKDKMSMRSKVIDKTNCEPLI